LGKGYNSIAGMDKATGWHWKELNGTFGIAFKEVITTKIFVEDYMMIYGR
jgi:hypothetical protein